MVSQAELNELADIIVKNIKEEFGIKHMSGNLAKTIKVVNMEDTVQVIIPAEIYNMKLYQQKGIIKKTYTGSYASRLDKTGSEFISYPTKPGQKAHWVRPKNHVGFVNTVINKSIAEWLSVKSSKYKLAEREEKGE